MLEFKKCDTCRDKSGSPLLCEGCLHNRFVIGELGEQMRRLTADRNLQKKLYQSTKDYDMVGYRDI